jgi:hydrogenase expression/formation protein HypC
MCLSIPGKIIEINGNRAKVDINNVIYNAGTGLTDDLKIGDFVLLHAGCIIKKIDIKEAEESLELFSKMSEL